MNRRSRHCLIALLAPVAISGMPALSQEAASVQQATDSPARSDAKQETTAEDVLRAFQKSRPPNELLQPSETSGSKPALSARLLPEGTSIVDRTGRIERRDDKWVFLSHIKEGPESAYPMLLNATAETMVRTSEGAPVPIQFLISGEMTHFRGANYLLVRTAARASIPRVELPTEETTGAPSPESAEAAQANPPSAEEVLKALRSERPAVDPVSIDERKSPRPVVTATSLEDDGFSRSLDGNATGEARRTLRPDGTIFERRAGRFLSQGESRKFAADTNHADGNAPSYELLPCQATEFMLNQWTRSPHGLVFVVSGELTLFEGRNYLLPRLAMRQLASDNLRK